MAERAQLAGQSVFGESAIYTPSGGPPESIQGVFSAAGVRVELVGGVEVESTGPVLSIHLADLAGDPERGAGVVVRGLSFTVLQMEPDGEGDTKLFLEEV